MGEILKYKNVPVIEAAKMLDVSPQFVRVGLQKERLPIGTAIQVGDKDKWTYHISPGLLALYITGREPMIEVNELEKGVEQSEDITDVD